MRHLIALVFVFLLVVPATALGDGPIPAPTIREGQFVYTIPNGYTPAGMSRSQLDQLNGTLSNLHNPFYVMVMEDLPRLNGEQREYARSNGFRGDSETLRIETSTAMLMEDWAEQPRYDASNSSVFVIAFSPRKYAWHPSLTAKNEVGVSGRAQDPYTALFVSAAQQRPADYGRGISNLALKLDEHVFDQTDPTRIAARAETLRLRAEARRLSTAQGSLDQEILTLANLLDQTDHLPSDVASYRETLDKARSVRKANDPGAMLGQAEEMRSTVRVLDSAVSESRHKAQAKVAAATVKVLLVVGIFGFLLFAFIRRRNKYRDLRETFLAEAQDWHTRITNANSKWVDWYMDRDDVIGLAGVTGETALLLNKVTSSVDAIKIRISAMEAHVKSCAQTARRGTFFNLTPLVTATLDLESPFQFDTEKINEGDLFGGDTVTVRVTPTSFVKETGALFQDSIDGWKLLKKAALERIGDASEDMPHATMDSYFATAEALGIPEHWLSQHPLYGDDESDAAFYSSLNAVRDTDPLAYVHLLEQARSTERAVGERLAFLADQVESVNAARVTDPFLLGGTQVSSEDDPALTLSQAQAAESQLAGILASSSDPDEVAQKVEEAVRFYKKTLRQRAEITSALTGAKRSIEAARAKRIAAKAALKVAQQARDAAVQVHSRATGGDAHLVSFDRTLTDGERRLAQADRALKDSRHLDARRIADEAMAMFTQAEAFAKKVTRHCRGLDEEKASFDDRLRDLSTIRSRYSRKMNGYGSHSRSLTQPTNPSRGGVQDYEALGRDLASQESRWRKAVRDAESDYEDEQRRIRQERQRKEAEARRRRDEEAAAARRRRASSYSSSSSSSSSYGGGGFGGSSGGFGGGGFGGSSGSF